MNHRDYIVIKKIIDEINVAQRLIQGYSLSEFEADERTKRAICMTVINIGELVKVITDETREANRILLGRKLPDLEI